MNVNFSLNPDEVVRCMVEDIHYDPPKTGISKLVDSNPVRGLLVLTNERLLFTWEVGTFKKRHEMLEFAIADLTAGDGSVQIMLGTPKGRSRNATSTLTVFGSYRKRNLQCMGQSTR